ncbi:MAG TPA: hypothetical protein PK257_03500 [Candidatus Woesebacteria bacterium]|nr:hypothetical protein [Candidatus Woesebacteria bacterium]
MTEIGETSIKYSEKKLIEKPIPSSERPKDHFKQGDEVVVFLSRYEKEFIPGKIGIVEEMTETQVNKKGGGIRLNIEIDHSNGSEISLGYQSNDVMLLNEFRYLEKHPESISQWLDDSISKEDKKDQFIVEIINNKKRDFISSIGNKDKKVGL